IGGTPISVETKFPLHFIKWSLETEVESLKKIDVGIMPLVDDLESRGKAGFKLLQYMGLGIASIASPLTINTEIVDHNRNSFLANDINEWRSILIEILSNKVELLKIGEEARKTVEKNFSFKGNKKKYCNFIIRINNEN
ncbi:MAG: glycosyltransferase, partial [Bacteroidota bacterium]